MPATIDLIADLGEGFGDWTMGDDSALLDIVSSANVACGFHAGDPRIMDATARACAERGIQIGAHPSFPDLVGFGRRAMGLTADQVRTDIDLPDRRTLRLRRRQRHPDAARRAARPVGQPGRRPRRLRQGHLRRRLRIGRPRLIIVAQDGELADEASRRGLRVGIVGIVDRAYQADGTLVPRSQPGAVIHDVDTLVARAIRIATESRLEAVDGTVLHRRRRLAAAARRQRRCGGHRPRHP